jgi:hypothetical protein
MEKTKINVAEAIKISISWGFKNIISLIGAVLLWVITIWIPYLNVGTTIAIMTIPIELSKGKVINPVFIFDSKYRKYMGEYFILISLKSMAIYIGMLFLIIPAIVMSLTFSMSNFLLLDKGMGPLEAMTKSNKATYGNKVPMFLSLLAPGVVTIIALYILGLIPGTVGTLLQLIALALISPIFFSMKAYFYKTLVLDIETKE